MSHLVWLSTPSTALRRGRRWLLILAATLAVLSSPRDATAQVFVTEFLAINDSVLADEDGAFSDWIEIHNSSGIVVDLGGWHLTDDPANLTKWQFPATSVAAGGYVVVFASKKNRAVSGAELHTNFKLSGSGEYLALVRADGSTIEHDYFPAFPVQAANASYGLAADLLSERCFFNPTPGMANDESSGCGVGAPPEFSVQRGFYETPFSVAITTAALGADIYYTTDGSEPTPSSGTLYTGAVPVATTTVLRAAVFGPDIQPSASITHTYIFLDDVLGQTGAGFPQSGALDYEMDQSVVNDPLYAATLTDDLLAVPTLSMVMDVDDVFGDTDGIYTHPARQGIEWERPVSVELIYPDGTTGFQINCGTRIQGDISRTANRKKSFRLAFKSIYGPSRLEYPLFGPASVRSFNKIRLRASSQKSWSSGSTNVTYVRDQWVRETQLDMGRPASRGIFVHLYLNGLYWGLYNPVEKPDESFTSDHIGGNEQDWDVLKHYLEIVNGNRQAWDTAHTIADGGLSSAAAYAAIQGYIDVPNLIDYFIANLHAGTTDWDGNNWYAARRRAPGEGFKFFSWDAEQSLVSINTRRVSIASRNAPSTFYSALRDNAEFRVLFGDHVHRHFFNDGALTPARARQRFLDNIVLVDRAVVPESARWGDTAHSEAITRDNQWLEEVEWLRLAYFPRRTAVVLEQLRRIDLYPEIDAPTLSRHGGFIDAGLSLSMTAPVGTIYYTIDGSDPRLVGEAVSPAAIAYSAPVTISTHTTVKSRVLVGVDWSALTEANFTIDVPLRVTELMYHPVDPPTPGAFTGEDFEFLELTNTGTATVALAGATFTDGISFTFAADSLAPGERTLLVKNQAAFESRYGAGLPISGEYLGGLNNAGETIRLVDTAGGEVIEFTFSDRWYPVSDGDGFSLVIRDASAARDQWSRASGWRAGVTANGTPGVGEAPLCSDGVDNDGDGATDFPADTGCSDAGQDLEDPECSDGIDNDGDGSTDLSDLRCLLASGTTEAAPPGDTFICYRTRTAAAGERFEPVDVALEDELDGPTTHTLRDRRAICLPGSVDGDPVLDPQTHLELYSIKDTASTPKHVRRTGLLVEGLGPVFLDTSRRDRVLIPASMDPAGPVAPPVASAHDVDHYKCYKVRTTKKKPHYWPKGVQLHIADSLESRTYDLKRPTTLCMPADAEGGGIKNLDRRLLCYLARRSKGEARHTVAIDIHTATQFGQGRLDTRKVESICVPAR